MAASRLLTSPLTQNQVQGVEMRTSPKVVSLAAALAALGAPVAKPPIADAAEADGAQAASESQGQIHLAADSRPLSAEFMSFTVHQTSDGTMFPQHSSHSSHASHASHASSSPGYGLPDTPDLPSVPNLPYTPPVYVPGVPPVYPPPDGSRPGQTVIPPSGSTSDIAYVACARASSGLGVNDIASELVRRYGIAESDAVSIATQALSSVLGGGYYCGGPHGDLPTLPSPERQ
jgi:hypothetical protein